MGFSLKSVGNLVGKAVGASAGAFFGGPIGAIAGYSGANGILGAVGLGDDQLAAQEQWKWQKKASDYAFNQNLQMWNLQNAYNDPSAQMERLKAAGLNPNLVYGGGNVSGNTAGSGPTYERPGVNFQDKSLQREQLALAMQEFRQRVTNQAIENDMARQRLVLNEREADRSDRLAEAQIRAYAANLGLISEKIGDINFNQQHYVAPDRRGWIAKIADDLSDLVQRDKDNPVTKKLVEDYSNSLLHRAAVFMRDYF